ncbi:MAG: glycosyltransferase family 4 protein [Acidimicrobiia bacterium]
MRIAVVCPYDLGLPGGVQHQVLGLVERFRVGGDVAWAIGPGCPPDRGETTGGSVTIPANGSASPVAIDPRAWPRVRRALRSADVVHVHEPFIPVVSPAALGAGPPVVVTFHADPARWMRTAYRVAAPIGSRLLGTSVRTAVSEVAAAALPASWGPVEIIPNAIDVGGFPSDPDRAPGRVVFVGRDDPRKGLDVLLAAWPAVRAAVPSAELRVVGAERPPQSGIAFLGRMAEMEKRGELASAAVAVAPNLGGESFGIVVAEAMAAACAVVASDLPAFRAVLGGAGRLVPPGDQIALAEAIVDLLRSPDERSGLAAAARRSVARYDWTVVAGAYRDAYHRAASA